MGIKCGLCEDEYYMANNDCIGKIKISLLNYQFQIFFLNLKNVDVTKKDPIVSLVNRILENVFVNQTSLEIIATNVQKAISIIHIVKV